MVKVNNRGAFIGAWHDIFFNEMIENDIVTEEPTRFSKKM